MAKTEGSKRPFKEKIVQIYEAFFRVSHIYIFLKINPLLHDFPNVVTNK